MWPFGDSPEKAAAKAATKEEAERLGKLSLQGLAAEAIIAFGPEGMGIKSGHQRGAVQVAQWLLYSNTKQTKFINLFLGNTIEALQALTTAGLLTSAPFNRGSSTTYTITRKGEEALDSGSVRHLLED